MVLVKVRADTASLEERISSSQKAVERKTDQQTHLAEQVNEITLKIASADDKLFEAKRLAATSEEALVVELKQYNWMRLAEKEAKQRHEDLAVEKERLDQVRITRTPNFRV